MKPYQDLLDLLRKIGDKPKASQRELAQGVHTDGGDAGRAGGGAAEAPAGGRAGSRAAGEADGGRPASKGGPGGGEQAEAEAGEEREAVDQAGGGECGYVRHIVWACCYPTV